MGCSRPVPAFQGLLKSDIRSHPRVLGSWDSFNPNFPNRNCPKPQIPRGRGRYRGRYRLLIPAKIRDPISSAVVGIMGFFRPQFPQTGTAPNHKSLGVGSVSGSVSAFNPR